MTVQDFIDSLQKQIDLHASGLVDKPASLDSTIIFEDVDGNELTAVIEVAGGNCFEPGVIIKVF